MYQYASSNVVFIDSLNTTVTVLPFNDTLPLKINGLVRSSTFTVRVASDALPAVSCTLYFILYNPNVVVSTLLPGLICRDECTFCATKRIVYVGRPSLNCPVGPGKRGSRNASGHNSVESKPGAKMKLGKRANPKYPKCHVTPKLSN